MAEILKAYTPQQLYELQRDKVIADNVGLTNFNEGSRVRSILEAVALIASSTQFDFLEGLRQSIPIALFDGLEFSRKSASNSSGFIRLFRLPLFYMTYTGSDSSNTITINSTTLTTTTSGTPADDLSITFSSFPTVQDLVNEINTNSAYTAVVVGNNGGEDTTQLYTYSAKEIVGTANHLNTANSRDIMLLGNVGVVLPAALQVSVNDLVFQTTSGSNILAGDATSLPIALSSLTPGTIGNIIVNALDSLNGKGFISSAINGADYVINDSVFAGGENEENEEERSERFKIYVQGINRSTVIGIQAAVLEIDGIKSVTVRENFPQAGQFTVVADDGTGSLSAAQISEIIKVLDGDPDDLINFPGARAAGVTANVSAPAVIGVDVTIAIIRIGQISDETEIILNVKSAIEKYVNTRKIGDDVVLNEIRAISMAAHPANYDLSVSLPTANVPIDSSSLARTGSGTGGLVAVTVNTLT